MLRRCAHFEMLVDEGVEVALPQRRGDPGVRCEGDGGPLCHAPLRCGCHLEGPEKRDKESVCPAVVKVGGATQNVGMVISTCLACLFFPMYTASESSAAENWREGGGGEASQGQGAVTHAGVGCLPGRRECEGA